MSNAVKEDAHRGRFQAQGGGLEASESWSQSSPLSVKSALLLLKRLMKKISRTERKEREKAFKQTERFVRNAGENGGVFARTSKTYLVRGSKDKRVDIEVLKGKAFVKKEDK